MRLAISLAVFAIFVWAGLLTPTSKAEHAFATGNLLTAIFLTLVVALQHTSRVAKLLNTPSKKHRDAEEKTRGLAQTTLTDLVKGKKITEDRLGMFVHVWVVPFWYRALAPYSARQGLKWVTKKPRFSRFAKWTYRPTLVRLSAVGLVKRNSTHVRFAKGKGLVGICLSNNREDDVLALDMREDAMRDALNFPEEEWEKAALDLTHGLDQSDAKALAARYGQVIACVVQSPAGEPVGCVTISVPPGASIELISNEDFETAIHRLAQSVAGAIA